MEYIGLDQPMIIQSSSGPLYKGFIKYVIQPLTHPNKHIFKSRIDMLL